MLGTSGILLMVFSVCVLASGFLSGSETALTAIPRERVHRLAERGHRGIRLEELTGDPDRTLSTILVANNFVNILATSVATVIAIDLVGETLGPIVATVTVTALILVIGEVTPKTLAARRPEQFALIVATPIYVLARVLNPISRVFIALGRSILRLFRIRSGHDRGITEDDIRAMAVLGERDGQIEASEREIIESLFIVGDQPVREVMTPRVDVVALVAPVSSENVRQLVAASGHSRFPVVAEGGDLDFLLGVLYAKDVFRSERALNPAEIHQLIREPYYVPESLPVLRTLRDLRARKKSLAVVMDEHGGVDGLVTVKDLVGELVGEIQDEYDPREPATLPLGQGAWLVDGRLPADELEDKLHVELPDGPYTTVGGLFLYVSGRVPVAGDRIDVNDLRLTVVSMDKQRIDKLRIEESTGEPVHSSG
ncbi:MAG: hemolysin family protein [Acidimicrobiia bacterium]|nr:hemolysin family protein [Acidimicrobiia bacterium]